MWETGECTSFGDLYIENLVEDESQAKLSTYFTIGRAWLILYCIKSNLIISCFEGDYKIFVFLGED